MLMNKLYLIRGPLGIGKSTISKVLAAQIDADYISVDDILSKNNLDVLDESIGCISVDNFIQANNIIMTKLNKNRSLVIDGNFYHKAAIDHLISNIGDYDCKVFSLNASIETCISRDENRIHSIGKDAAIAVYNLVSKLEYGTQINVDNCTPDDAVQIILSTNHS